MNIQSRRWLARPEVVRKAWEAEETARLRALSRPSEYLRACHPGAHFLSRSYTVSTQSEPIFAANSVGRVVGEPQQNVKASPSSL